MGPPPFKTHASVNPPEQKVAGNGEEQQGEVTHQHVTNEQQAVQVCTKEELINARVHGPRKGRGMTFCYEGSDVFNMLQLCKIKSPAEFNERSNAKVKAKEAVLAAIADPHVPGQLKQGLRCEYVHDYGRHLFSCPGCWLLPGLCVCDLIHRIDHLTRVVVSCHPAEWCKSSNTGIIGALSTGGSMLLRGYKKHDEQLEAELADASTTKAILWPGDTAILPEELKAIANRETQGRVTLIAIDAHWSGARHLVGTFLPDILRVKLPAETVLSGKGKSLLSPLRSYHGDVQNNGRVCTLEAITALLFELEGDKRKHDLMIENLKIKVDAVLVQKSKPPLVMLVWYCGRPPRLKSKARGPPCRIKTYRMFDISGCECR